MVSDPGVAPGQQPPPRAVPPAKAPITLYLVNSLGGRYGAASGPVNWSRDGRRALFTKTATGHGRNRDQ